MAAPDRLGHGDHWGERGLPSFDIALSILLPLPMPMAKLPMTSWATGGELLEPVCLGKERRNSVGARSNRIV